MGRKVYSHFMSDFKELERITKGVANHRRLEIAFLLERRPQLSLSDIAQKLKVDFRTISEHTRKLEHAGLVKKRYYGAYVQHELSPLGKIVLRFLKGLV